MPPYSNDDVTAEHLTRAVTSGVASVATSLTSPFAPGSIVAGRYRLVALLGRGGMGEVYRADDLTLDLPVALKFLPERIPAGDPRLPQFHNELRIARMPSTWTLALLMALTLFGFYASRAGQPLFGQVLKDQWTV